MTTPSNAPLRQRLLREYAALRAALVARRVLRAFAACAVALAAVVVAGVALPGGSGPATARLVLFGLGVLGALAFALARLRAELPRFGPWLESVETRLPELRSWLRNALDLEAAPPRHTSAALADALNIEAARRLAAAPLAAGRPRVRAGAPLAAAGAAALAIAALALLAPAPALRSWRTLWNPALAAPPVTLAVEPGSVTVAPGATLAVRARVSGSAAAPRLLGDGANPAPQLETIEHGMHRWRFDLPPVTRARHYAVRVLASRSPDYRIALAGEPQPVSFAFEYRAPAYARLPAQSGTSTRGDVAALRGSVAAVEVTFDRDLESLVATLPGGRTQEWNAVTPRRWRGRVPVDADGEWSMRAQAASGAATSRWRVSALPDAPPVITVARPTGDQDLPSGSRIPYDVLVEDDLGLADLRLQYRKDATQPWRDAPVAAFKGGPREARVSADWDASALALLPGESGSFRFVVRDDDPLSPGIATSPEFRLRFPTMAELYQNLDQRQDRVQASLRQVAEEARELQKTLDQLQRQQPKSAAATPPHFERGEEMRKALERQQALAEQLAKAADEAHESSADAAERQAYRAALQEKLHEMSDLMTQIQSPEFHDAVQRMREALERMDRAGMEQQLPRLRDANRDLLKSVERNLALLRQLRDEERMDALARRAQELGKQQDAMNTEHQSLAKPDAPRREGASPEQQRAQLGEREREAAARSEELARDARETASTTASDQAKQDLENAANDLEAQAAAAQRLAAQLSEAGQSVRAAQSGQQASSALQQAARRMQRVSAAESKRLGARQLAAVRRSAQDLVSLGQEAAGNMSSPSATPDQQANRQTDLADGVARVADSLATVANETPLLPPQVQQALGRAQQGLSSSGREMAQGNRSRGMQDGQSAGAALRDAVNGLRRAEASMCRKGGSQPGEGEGENGQRGEGQQPGDGESESLSPGERLGNLGSQQGQLNERSSELARRLSQAMRLSAGDQAELRRLADEQARLRSELEDIQRQDEQHHQLLGRLDQAHRDMQQAEEQLRQGQTGDDLEDRQTHILSRLLDAQRSLNRRDYDPQRESRSGADVSRAAPAPLPASLLRENDRLRLDLMKADEDRYPAQYRALIERYLRRLNGSTR